MNESDKYHEKNIVSSLKKGNYMAFNQLFDEYSRRIYYFALKILKTEEDAEEIVQDVFLKIWENRKNLNAELSFKSYLFTIASNGIKKQFIHKVKEDEYKHELASELINFNDSTENQLDYKILLDRIEKLIEEMPPRRKDIFLKRKKEGISVKLIASELNISEKTVENQLTQALKFLKNDLKKQGFSGLLFFCLFFD